MKPKEWAEMALDSCDSSTACVHCIEQVVRDAVHEERLRCADIARKEAETFKLPPMSCYERGLFGQAVYETGLYIRDEILKGSG